MVQYRFQSRLWTRRIPQESRRHLRHLRALQWPTRSSFERLAVPTATRQASQTLAEARLETCRLYGALVGIRLVSGVYPFHWSIVVREQLGVIRSLVCRYQIVMELLHWHPFR